MSKIRYIPLFIATFSAQANTDLHGYDLALNTFFGIEQIEGKELIEHIVFLYDPKPVVIIKDNTEKLENIAQALVAQILEQPTCASTTNTAKNKVQTKDLSPKEFFQNLKEMQIKEEQAKKEAQIEQEKILERELIEELAIPNEEIELKELRELRDLISNNNFELARNNAQRIVDAKFSEPLSIELSAALTNAKGSEKIIEEFFDTVNNITLNNTKPNNELKLKMQQTLRKGIFFINFSNLNTRDIEILGIIKNKLNAGVASERELFNFIKNPQTNHLTLNNLKATQQQLEALNYWKTMLLRYQGKALLKDNNSQTFTIKPLEKQEIEKLLLHLRAHKLIKQLKTQNEAMNKAIPINKEEILKKRKTEILAKAEKEQKSNAITISFDSLNNENIDQRLNNIILYCPIFSQNNTEITSADDFDILQEFIFELSKLPKTKLNEISQKEILDKLFYINFSTNLSDTQKEMLKIITQALKSNHHAIQQLMRSDYKYDRAHLKIDITQAAHETKELAIAEFVQMQILDQGKDVQLEEIEDVSISFPILKQQSINIHIDNELTVEEFNKIAQKFGAQLKFN